VEILNIPPKPSIVAVKAVAAKAAAAAAAEKRVDGHALSKKQIPGAGTDLQRTRAT
jgi:hypothetical protein